LKDLQTPYPPSVAPVELSTFFGVIGVKKHSIRFRKSLEESIPEVVPRFEVQIWQGTLRFLLEKIKPTNLSEFPTAPLDGEYYFATQRNLLLHRAQCLKNQRSEYVVSGPWTAERFRGYHTAPAVLVYMMRRLKSEHVKELYYSTAGWNLASQRCALRAGFQVEKISYEYYAFGRRLRFRSWVKSFCEKTFRRGGR